MTLIHFDEPKDGRCRGYSAGFEVAKIITMGLSWQITHCIGMAAGVTSYHSDVFSAQEACNAYMAKFLLDIGFVPGNHAVTK